MRVVDVHKWLFKHSSIYTYIRSLLLPIRHSLRLANFNVRYRNNNKHNLTTGANIFPIEKVEVGKGTYGELKIYAFGGDNEGLYIGNYCSIAGDVVFLLGGNHCTDTISTYPFGEHIFVESVDYKIDKWDKESKGKIIISDDVWIGHGVIILSGVHIGQGAVIGAGSVVSKDVPPYAIFVNNEVKKYRFSPEIINVLIELNLGVLCERVLLENRILLSKTVTGENVHAIVEALMTEYQM